MLTLLMEGLSSSKIARQRLIIPHSNRIMPRRQVEASILVALEMSTKVKA
jgi:hypothetical protein